MIYREAHVLWEELADAVAENRRKSYIQSLASVPLLIIDAFGMRKLPLTAAEDLLKIVMHRYERASTLLTSNRPVEARRSYLSQRSIFVPRQQAGGSKPTERRFNRKTAPS